jgi:membrane protease YdiL (CAAX protease family)
VLGRVALFWGAYLAIIFGLGMLKATAPAPTRELVWGALSALAVFEVTRLFLRRERRATESVGIQWQSASLARFGLGALIGFAFYGLHLLVVTLLGGVRFERVAGTGAGMVALAAATYVALSAMEELGYRGYALRSLVPAFGFWPGQLIVALAFAANHVLFGWSWQAALTGVLAGGLVFGMAALASGGLAVPIGLHAAWNAAAWAIGDKGLPGLWQAGVAEGAVDRASRIGTVSYFAVHGLMIVVLLIWYSRKRRVDIIK